MKKLKTLACPGRAAAPWPPWRSAQRTTWSRSAFITDMSGLYSDVSGNGERCSGQMAIDDFRRQGARPASHRDVSADHQNKADIAANKAREWIDTTGRRCTATGWHHLGTALAVHAKVAKEKNRIINISARPRRP
jgi:branched-chain amino acid transport system substrate-binding protein